jgi:hypothetical protein
MSSTLVEMLPRNSRASEIGVHRFLPTRQGDCVAFPNPPDKRYAGGRLLGSLSGKPVWLNNVERIRDTVEKKGYKYGRLVASLDTPLVVAVLSVAGFAEQEDVTEAMYDNKAVQVRRDNPRSVTALATTFKSAVENEGLWGAHGTMDTPVSGRESRRKR